MDKKTESELERIYRAITHVLKRFQPYFEHRGFELLKFPSAEPDTLDNNEFFWQFYFNNPDGKTEFFYVVYGLKEKKLSVSSQGKKIKTKNLHRACRFIRDLMMKELIPSIKTKNPYEKK